MPANQINSIAKMDALEIEDEVIDAIQGAGPDGLSYQDGSDAIGLSYDRFYYLVGVLVSLGRVKIELSRRGKQHRILLPHQEAPARSAITARQKEVLDYLSSEMDEDGLSCPSFGRIAKHTSARCPAFILDRLDYKGFVEVVDRGGPYANIYRVYPKGDGPRGYSPMKAKP